MDAGTVMTVSIHPLPSLTQSHLSGILRSNDGIDGSWFGWSSIRSGWSCPRSRFYSS